MQIYFPSFRILSLSTFLFGLVVSLFALPLFAQSQTLKYSYDELGRLTFVEDSRNGNRDYDYDSAGNRKQVAVGKVASPNISPNGGTFSNPVTVTLSTPTTGATIRYVTSGDVTNYAAVYTGPFVLSTSCTLKVKVFKEGVGDSDQVSAVFTITSLQPPSGLSVTGPLSPQGGGYSFRWNAVADATYYEYSLVGGSVSTTTALSASSAGPRPWWVRACNTQRCGEKAYF